MNSANVCRLCRASADVTKTVNLFSTIGIKHKWASRVAAILDIDVQDNDRFSPYVCYKCICRLEALENSIADHKAFRELAGFRSSPDEEEGWCLM